MPPAARARAALRRCLVVAILILALPMLLTSGAPGVPIAEAVTRTVNRWTVTPGVVSEIQPAIDAARDNGGGRVRLPAGVYQLYTKIRLHDNVTVFGDGMDQTILRWTPSVAPDHMMSNGSLSEGNTNIQVWGLSLDGQGKPSDNPDDCCLGLRLNNVRNSTFVNVAADGFSRDGIYLGYNHDDGAINGAINVRLSGCRANNNLRNGIALIHGDGNVIDGCQVNGNNRGEDVAGIDLEPDEGLSITNSRVVGNTANGQNVGIQIYLPYNGFATTYHNAVCYNTTIGNRRGGVYSLRGDQNIFVGNNTSGNGTDFSVDDSSLIGDAYRGWCTLPALPPHPSTLDVPTPVPTPRPSCSPRPPVTVTTTRGASGTLQVTVQATRSAAAPNNTIGQIAFGPAQNAVVEINGQTKPGGGFTATMPGSTQQIVFQVRRGPAGAASTTVPFVVRDDCGGWNTFVGGGAGAF